MAKFYFLLFTVVALQSWVQAAQSNSDSNGADKSEQIQTAVPDSPTLDSKPYGIADDIKNTDDKTIQGQRQKRFDSYFDFGFLPFSHLYPFFPNRGHTKRTNVYGTESEDPLSIIFRRVQEIVSYTRQQAFSPPSIPPNSVPSFIPVYIAHGACGCTPDINNPPNNVPPNQGPNQGNGQEPDINQGPSIGQEPDINLDPTVPRNEQPIAPTTPTFTTTYKPQTVTPPNNSIPAAQSPTDYIPEFTDRGSLLPETSVDTEYDDDEDDGSRPISFDPIMPDMPLSRPPPPVEHGSSQAERGDQPAAASTTTISPPLVGGYPAQPDLPTDSIPTLCDGAVLTCCHQPDVTYDCFELQGCPEPSGPNDPCDAKMILRVVNKFQNYYANRKG